MTPHKKPSRDNLRRKRQVEGERHSKRISVYFSEEERALIKNAARRNGMSSSQYCAMIALREAAKDFGGK